jgi:hypothetical protein
MYLIMVKKRVSKFIYWFPRILAVIFILFLSLFSLDIFDMQLGFWGTILGLLMHNIPSLILLAALLISWKKHEIVGGIVFILAGVIYFLINLINTLKNSSGELSKLFWGLLISGPAILIGILFLINWFKEDNHSMK